MAWSRNKLVEIFDLGEFLFCETKASSITRCMWACSFFWITTVNTHIPSENLFADSNF